MEFLQPLENLSLPPLERAVLNVLKGVLDYPATSEARAAKIADSIVFFCTTDLDADQEIGGVFLALWDVILELVTVIPPGHDWQQTLALTLNTVRQREGTASDEHTNYNWSNLPDFYIQLTEHWQQKATDGDSEFPLRLSAWKSVNSFVSRLVGAGFTQVINLAIWEIREALEEAPTKEGPLMDCRVWIAAEWIANSSEVLRNEMMRPSDELTERDATSTSVGQLLLSDGISPRSLQRWQFWKKRLAEIADEAESLGIVEETRKHIDEALKIMDS